MRGSTLTARLAMEVVRKEYPTPEGFGSRPEPVLSFQNGHKERFELNPWSSRQLSTYTNIPQTYYDRIAGENPDLLARNVNHGLHVQAQQMGRGGKTESRMLRTYRGALRGFVSSSYRRLDCCDLLETVLPIIAENGFVVDSAEITDRRMYLQVTTPRIIAEEVSSGCRVVLSEIFAIESAFEFILRTDCDFLLLFHSDPASFFGLIFLQIQTNGKARAARIVAMMLTFFGGLIGMEDPGVFTSLLCPLKTIVVFPFKS